jgi:capsular exopolysaccharide synthesis family protein
MMASAAVTAQAQTDLAEALREIHLMAGLNPTDQGTQSRRRPLAIGVTSPTYGDGKTTVAIALAASLARDFETDVTLADADFHTHSVGREYGLQGAGLSEAIAGQAVLEEVAHRVSRERLTVIPAGSMPVDPARLARSEHLTTLIDNLKRTNEFVVIDLPALFHSMNTPVLARRCDAVLVVARAGTTTRQDVERALHLLKDSRVLGVVVNRSHSSVPGPVRRALNLRG